MRIVLCFYNPAILKGGTLFCKTPPVLPEIQFSVTLRTLKWNRLNELKPNEPILFSKKDVSYSNPFFRFRFKVFSPKNDSATLALFFCLHSFLPPKTSFFFRSSSPFLLTIDASHLPLPTPSRKKGILTIPNSGRSLS